MKIYYWPDGMWCFEEELSDMTHKSDDISCVYVSDDCVDDVIDDIVQRLTASNA